MIHQKRILTFCFLGTFFALLGLSAIIILPSIISMLVHQKMALIDGNPSFPIWRDLDLPIYQKFYFFNVTNPREVENGQKPNLVEVGPFVFRQNLSKSALNWSDDNKKLTFRETKQYYFDRELSIADLNITVSILICKFNFLFNLIFIYIIKIFYVI